MERAFNVYNNTIHSIIKVEALKAFNFKKKQIKQFIENTNKSQININKDSIEVVKSSKALLCKNFIKRGNVLSECKNKKKI